MVCIINFIFTAYYKLGIEATAESYYINSVVILEMYERSQRG